MTKNRKSRRTNGVGYQPRYKEPELPDPLAGLSPSVRRGILLTRPTWSERWRLCNPELTKEEKRDLIIDILFERRRAYDEAFFLQCKRAELERWEERYRTGEIALMHSSAALATTVLNRSKLTERERRFRNAYQERRDFKLQHQSHQYDHEPER